VSVRVGSAREWATPPMTVPGSPIDSHLARFESPQRDTLSTLRDTLRELLPDAEECISYNMPCFRIDGVAVAGFDGLKRHCSYVPHSGRIVDQVTGIPAWCSVASSGTLQFPVDRPLPEVLVRRLVQARLREITDRRSSRGRGRGGPSGRQR
jgi:uncharacterized protein YdhG (YjbR/CyaY superfamily)